MLCDFSEQSVNQIDFAAVHRLCSYVLQAAAIVQSRLGRLKHGTLRIATRVDKRPMRWCCIFPTTTNSLGFEQLGFPSPRVLVQGVEGAMHVRIVVEPRYQCGTYRS